MKDIGEQFVLITGISWMPGMLLPRAHKNFFMTMDSCYA